MKANELRIGNWVKDISTNTSSKLIYHIVHSINSQAINDTPIESQWFEPIPLKPEILERILQSRKISADCYRIGEIDLYIKKIITCDEWAVFIHNENETTLGYKYLHQLQNLYFDLTGRELSVIL
jgi:hypothetical protein